jgi:molybdopterin/thiamine biosynthesis adenylyltransferase
VKPSIIITEDLVRTIKKSSKKKIDLYGLSRKKENLVQVRSFLPYPDLKKVATCCAGQLELKDFDYRTSLAKIQTISFFDDFTSRSREIIDTDALLGKTVTFIGNGSVGSQLALHCAQSAVGHFRLLDPDILSIANLSRHACDLSDVGRHKTFAVRDHILRRNPRAEVSTFEEDFLSLDWEAQIDRLQGSDLVVASTDSNEVQFSVNDVCHELGISSIYVGCYERACAGEILYVIPGKTPCFHCFMEFRHSKFEGAKKKNRRIPYSNEDPSSFKAEPGLGVDISYLVSVASAYILALLGPDSERGKILDPERNLILIHSGSLPKGVYRDIFRMPFDLLQARVMRDKECLVCQKRILGGENGSSINC